MIPSFRSKALRRFAAQGDASKLPVRDVGRVRRILAALDVASEPGQMNLPGWRFHGLHDTPKRHAVDASGNYRINFGFDGQDAIAVDIEGDH